ncbi:hypothetical protein IQ07DRAFT_569186 [Pyrenochaeta sp. DS3sAY3a]|nr:hypothetical protein IQ07DRAFT_569186 [Pyrenochaeta sp. DS3sAY3a]
MFDPWMQPITLYFQDGTNFTIGVEDLDNYRLYGCRLAINYGSQIGASVILLLVLLLLTRAEKRKSFIFLANAFCLTANTIRCILLCRFLTGSMWHPYSQFAGDWSRVTTSDLATSVASNTMTLLVTILIMVSLSLQVWVVCVTTAPFQRYMIMAVTSVMACIAIGYKATAVIYNIKQALLFEPIEPYKNYIGTSYVTQAASIILFSCVFTYKLGYAIIQRRRLNMPQFGPMQVVFIMGCQTMLIPAIFSLLQFHKAVPEFGTQVLTIVCIFLPLSAIWAGVANDSSVARSGPNSHFSLIQGEFSRSSGSNSASRNNGYDDKSRGLSVSTYSNVKERELDGSVSSPRAKSSPEDKGIHVDRKFGYTHREADDLV